MQEFNSTPERKPTHTGPECKVPAQSADQTLTQPLGAGLYGAHSRKTAELKQKSRASDDY